MNNVAYIHQKPRELSREQRDEIITTILAKAMRDNQSEEMSILFTAYIESAGLFFKAALIEAPLESNDLQFENRQNLIAEAGIKRRIFANCFDKIIELYQAKESRTAP